MCALTGRVQPVANLAKSVSKFIAFTTISRMKSQAFFASPDDCARAFYEAFAQADIEALMSVWADDEDICCAHPAAAPLYGYAAVRSAWEAILRNSAKIYSFVKSECS